MIRELIEFALRREAKGETSGSAERAAISPAIRSWREARGGESKK